MKQILSFVIVSLCVLLSFPSTDASTEKKLHAGVAANYIQVFKELSTLFETETGITVEATYTSSGTLYGQIVNGAPYDIFLSADEERPERLFKENLAEKPFIYAKGEVVLWSANRDFCTRTDWQHAVNADTIGKIAIANPKTAPYGLSAMNVLQKMGLWDKITPKLVYAQDIAQAFQYASTGSVDACFCSLSATFTREGRKGCLYTIKEAPQIIQSACVVKSTKARDMAQKFATFLVSPRAEAIKKKYGYR